MKPPVILFLACFSSFPFFPFATAAPDFQQLDQFAKRTENTVFRDQLEAHWTPDGKTLWYRIQTGAGSHEFVAIDLATGQRSVANAFQALKLPGLPTTRTSALETRVRNSKRTGEPVLIRFQNELGVPVHLSWVNPDGKVISYGRVDVGQTREQSSFAGHVWQISEPDGKILAVWEATIAAPTVIVDGPGRNAEEKKGGRSREVKSPDGKWSAFLKDRKVFVKAGDAGEPTAFPVLSSSGNATFDGPIQWAPDSSCFIAFLSEVPAVRTIPLITSSPKDGLQPTHREIAYRKPGDPLPTPSPVIFRVQEGATIIVDNALFPTPFTERPFLDVRWQLDSQSFTFDYNQRGHQLYRIISVDARTGVARTVVEECSATFIDYTQKTWRHWLDASGELIWMSERDGWCHLWLYNAQTGEVRRRITHGKWVVREVLRVDETKGEIWFLASGLRAGEDPYHEHLCRISVDGTGFRQLTQADGQHRVEWSPDHAYFIDTWSRADCAPTTELRRSSDGSLVCVLERADISGLLATGWRMPERFSATGRDGATVIHGMLIKPSHFDPAKLYPVVEEIYAGPHSAFVPKTFARQLREHLIAEMGCIVVRIDGMGTNHRGKAFHDVAWKNLKDAGFPDRIAWMQAAAATRPWMHLGRVGIYGGSAGGQSAMRALLDHHDFYKVAVADCGCHDNRMDKIWWNEQWLGWPLDDSYLRNSNTVEADKLQGQLLLIVGELDENVDPASTLQVVHALQKAGKTFEFMPIIGAGHGAAETPYGSRLRMRFLQKHLLEAEGEHKE